ncbi:hypothetical protein [Nostoc sp. 106C]|uniref:hypothetical protein n=1 Tax=Nostoc sp. 106C TaxID=1932667 RepID=UPI0011808528|nr:hypothetical protein [Nostoc sp. 106C]
MDKSFGICHLSLVICPSRNFSFKSATVSLKGAISGIKGAIVSLKASNSNLKGATVSLKASNSNLKGSNYIYNAVCSTNLLPCLPSRVFPYLLSLHNL